MRSIAATLLVVAMVAAFAHCRCTGTGADDMTHLRIGYQPSTLNRSLHRDGEGMVAEDLAPRHPE